MEGLPKNNNEIKKGEGRELKLVIQEIKDVYVRAADQYLKDGDNLKSKIVDYYSGRPGIDEELAHLLANKKAEEIESYVQVVKNLVSDEKRFIEKMERFFGLQDVRGRRRELVRSDRLASSEEYELGVYLDLIEPQVRDAVVNAYRKGYLTFQSGFREKNDREQFFDVYNKNIVVPEEILRYLKDRSIEVRVENFDDRTTLTLHHGGNNLIRLTEWKEIWDKLVEALPPANPETVPNPKVAGEHDDFRKQQDELRK